MGAQGYLTLRRGARAQLVTNQPHGVLGLGGVREFGDDVEVISGSIYSVVPASSALARMAAQVLRAPAGTPLAVVDRVRRLRPSKSRPKNVIRWDRSFMIASQVGDLWTVDFSKPAPGSLQSQERANLRPVLEEVALSATIASDEEAAKLGLVGKGPAAVLTVVRKSYDTNRRPIEYLLVVSHNWTVQQFSHTPRTSSEPHASLLPRGTRLFEDVEAERRALHAGITARRPKQPIRPPRGDGSTRRFRDPGTPHCPGHAESWSRTSGGLPRLSPGSTKRVAGAKRGLWPPERSNFVRQAPDSGKPRSRQPKRVKAAGLVVDTARPGVAADRRRKGGTSTAARNRAAHAARKASFALEDARAPARPSRKSTRSSENRAKPESNLQRRQRRKLHSPDATARRAKGRSR